MSAKKDNNLRRDNGERGPRAIFLHTLISKHIHRENLASMQKILNSKKSGSRTYIL